MAPVKRTVAVAGPIIVVVIGVLLVQRFDRDRSYLRLLRAGEQALNAGDSYGAVDAFTGAITLKPDSMVAYFRRGQARYAQHRDEDAIRDLREAARLAPNAPQPLIVLGDLYDSRGDAAQAAYWYGQARTPLSTEDPTLLYKLALARYRAGSPAEAIEPLRQAIAQNDSVGEAHYLLGLVYRDTQKSDEAVASLEKAVKVSPSLTPAREELADLYRSRGRYVDEMAQLQALAALDGKTNRSVAIAMAEARNGQYAGAMGTLGVASGKPTDSHIQLALARIYMERAERTSDRVSAAYALAVLEKALGGTARRSEGLALYGRALFLTGDYSGAERILREAVATSPVAPDGFGYLADASERLAHYVDARDALLALDALQGDTASALVRAARAERAGALSLKARDISGALTYLTRAVADGRREVTTFVLLAQAQLQAGHLREAREAIAKGLELDPRHPELLRLQRTLR